MKKAILKSGVVMALVTISFTAVSCDLFGTKANVEPEPAVENPVDSIDAKVDSADVKIDSAKTDAIETIDAKAEDAKEEVKQEAKEATETSTEKK